jgi:hypothetical protein
MRLAAPNKLKRKPGFDSRLFLLQGTDQKDEMF